MGRAVRALGVVFSLMVSGVAANTWPQQDGDVTVIWQDPEQYLDVKSTSGRQSRYQHHVFATLGKHFQAQLASSLPVEHGLTIRVTQLDLAGEVQPIFANASGPIRVIKSLYPPKITFEYEWRDNHGTLLKSDLVQLRDLGFDWANSGIYRHQSLRYEMQMIDRWVTHQWMPLLGQGSMPATQ